MSSVPPATTAADPASVIGTALVSLLGPWGALAALAYKFGEPFVASLIANASAGTDPTADEWAKLTASINVPGTTLIPARPVVAP